MCISDIQMCPIPLHRRRGPPRRWLPPSLLGVVSLDRTGLPRFVLSLWFPPYRTDIPGLPSPVGEIRTINFRTLPVVIFFFKNCPKLERFLRISLKREILICKTQVRKIRLCSEWQTVWGTSTCHAFKHGVHNKCPHGSILISLSFSAQILQSWNVEPISQ